MHVRSKENDLKENNLLTALKKYWKSTFDFPKIVNNYGLNRGKVSQIVQFISHFSLKLYIQY